MLVYPTLTSVMMGGVYTVLNVFGVYDVIGGLNSECRITFLYACLFYQIV